MNNQKDTQKYRQKRQTTREPIDPGDDAVMYIPISTTSSCPAGSNSVADASVNGISQAIFRNHRIRQPITKLDLFFINISSI